jgi:8-oxo-dGTP diphosphatase
MWRDSSGRSLSEYPHPSVAVDVALLAVVWTERRGTLSVLLHRPESGFAAGQWCLPGVMVQMQELLSDAALRALRDKGGVTGKAPRQLRVFDAPDRDERGRVLSVAHVDVVPEVRPAEAESEFRVLAPIAGDRAQAPGRQRRLPYDHDLIVSEAVAWARSAYGRRADPFRLLGKEFTLSDLQKVHEAVAGVAFVKDTFRRAFSEYLVPTGGERTGTVGRPAALYRHMTRVERHEHRRQREERRATRGRGSRS